MFSYTPLKLVGIFVLAPLLSALGVLHAPHSGPNSPPVAAGDSYTIHGSAGIGSVLANDFDPDGDPMSPDVLTFPTHGTLSGAQPGFYFYTLTDLSFTGTDTFTYRACDPLQACSGGVTVTITVVNQAPVGGGDSYTIHGETTIGPLLVNDSDGDGDPLSCLVVTTPAHGTLFGLQQQDMKRYRPNQCYVGADSFTYQVCDPYVCSAPITVTLNVVNQSPVAVADSYPIRGATIIGPLLANDYDPDADPLNPTPEILTFPQHGTLAGLTQPDKKLYTPNPGYIGTDSFTYRTGDSLCGFSAPTAVTLFIVGDGDNDGETSCNANVGEPVNVTNGNMYLQQNDYQLPSVGFGVNVTRTYNSNSQRLGLFGLGWSTLIDESVVALDANLLRFNQPDGRAIYFGRPAGSSSSFMPVIGDFHGQITQNGGGFTLTMTDGSVHQFNASGKLLSLVDRNGNTTSLSYNASGFVSSIVDPFGRILTVATNTNGQATSISDTLGTIASYTYGGSNELSSVTYADNSAFNFSYDGNLRMTAVTDALGNVVESHSYDSQGRALTSAKHNGVEQYTLSYVSDTRTDVTDVLGRVTQFTFDKSKGRNVVTRVEGLCSCGGSPTQSWTYDNQLNMTSHTNALAQTATYTYDANGNVITATGVLGSSSFSYNQFGQVLTATDAMNGVTTNTYDAAGNLLSVTDTLNHTTTFSYDARGQLLTMTNALGKVTTLTWDTIGRLTQVKDALNNTTNFAYDARARLTSATNALNFTTSYAYDAAGRINKITRPGGTFVIYTYDLAGRRTKFTDALNNSTTFTYDGAYRLTGQTDALLKSVSYTYDPMSNLTAATDQLSRTTNVEYDEFNRPIKTIYPPAVVGGTRLQETVEYDAVGNVTKRTDAAGRVTTFTYDNANRLTTVTDPLLQVTQYEYNARSNVTAVEDALGQRYDFDHDALGRVTATTRAGLMMSFAYDAVGNRTQRTDYNNMPTAYTYDALNRLTGISYPDSSTVSYSYDSLSRLTSATNINGTVSFVYDNLGRVTSTTDVWGQVLNYTYDANDRRTKVSIAAATNAAYLYDAVGRITRITDSSGKATNFTYDAAGQLLSRALPNSVVTSYTSDGLGRVTRIKDAKNNTVIADNNYTYNSASQIIQNVDQGGTHSYSYDVLDRLTAATYTGAPNESYAYDGVGNRTTSHRSASYSYQPFNRLTGTSSASYLYDNNGSMISKADGSGTNQFAWDFENRLTQVVTPASGSITYNYDALGRRVQSAPSTGPSTNFTYDGQDVVQDKTSTNVTTEYTNGLGIDDKVRQKAGNTVYYFAKDHLGSTTALTDSKGALVERQTYDAYGNSAGSTRTRYGFTGRERDSLTGLMYYRARFYDPQLGRFVSEDPIGLSGGINSFAYVSNNPQNRTDPSGLYDIDVHYYLTYYLALKTGCFTDYEARWIAWGNQDSDESDRKKPGWGYMIVNINGKPTPVPDYAQRYRNAAFHAFGTPAENAKRAAELLAEAYKYGGQLVYFGTYLHFLQDSFSHRDSAGNTAWGQSAWGNTVDHTNFDPKRAMDMARATFKALKEFGRQRGCECDGEPDWKVVQRFIDVGYPPGSPPDFLRGVSDPQLRKKIQILGVPWMSPTGR